MATKTVRTTSDLQWIREPSPHWDAAKQRIIGEAPAGIFDASYGTLTVGDAAPGEWWRVERAGAVLGFGWMDVVWGDAEILLATADDVRGGGVGSFVMEHLVEEAAGKGLNYVYNRVREGHPHGAALTAWLQARGFEARDDGRLVRRARRAG